MSDSGSVVTYHGLAREIGERILAAGGNAADAFIATTLAENVLAEGASSLAGPLGALVCWKERVGAPIVWLDADFDHPLDPMQHCKPRTRARGKAVLVPGAPLGLWELARNYGSMPFSALVEPAARLAEEGFAVNPLMAGFLRWRQKTLARTEYGRRTFFRDHAPLRAGDLLRQPELAALLRRFGENGPDDLYRGTWAERFLATVRDAGGFLGEDDLAHYAVHWRPPWHGSYRGHTLYTSSGASFGGIWVLLALQVWEHAAGHSWSEAERMELMIRIARHVWAEPYLFDPDVLAQPSFIQPQLSGARAAAIWERVRNGEPAPAMGAGGSHSYHVIAHDRDGNIVSGTTTIESQPWGDGIFVEGVPLTTAGTIPWGTVRGRRRISPITAQFVFREAQPRFVVGTISNSLLESAFQILVNLIDAGMPAAAAVSAPRFGTFPPGKWWRRDVPLLDRNWLDPRVPKSLVRQLKRRGIKVVQSGEVDTGLGAVLALLETGTESATVPLPHADTL